MKKFMDIENARFEDIDLGNGIIRKNNIGAFEIGDEIQITEKFDGSNASFTYEDGILKAFSRKNELSFNSTLNGFWNWVQTLSANEYKEESQYIYFGEWGNKNKIVYNQDAYKIFYFYDIYDKENKCYMPQSFVKAQAEIHHLTYIHELYNGPFISWKHCKSFLNTPAYGERQEGIVIKSQIKLNDSDNYNPFYLKIVNDDFKESMARKIGKTVDPDKVKEKEHAQELMSQIVTFNRVEKEIHKMVDEGILDSEITPKDMSIVARNLPKRIYEDCIKEESEIVQAAGEYSGKICSQLTMKYAKQIILGN